RRGVRVLVVLDDHDEWAALHRGEVDALVEGPGRGRAVADIHQADAVLLSHLERERDASHHRHHVAKRRYLADKPPLEIAEVDVELPSTRRRIRFGHVLLEDLD